MAQTAHLGTLLSGVWCSISAPAPHWQTVMTSTSKGYPPLLGYITSLLTKTRQLHVYLTWMMPVCCCTVSIWWWHGSIWQTWVSVKKNCTWGQVQYFTEKQIQVHSFLAVLECIYSVLEWAESTNKDFQYHFEFLLHIIQQLLFLWILKCFESILWIMSSKY